MKKLLVSDPDKADVILLVDVHNLVWKSYFAPVKNEELDSKGYPTYHYRVALSKIVTAVEYLFKESNKVCIVLSSDEYPTKKKSLFPEYKDRPVIQLKEYTVKTKSGKSETTNINPIKDIKKFLSLLPHCNISVSTKDEETDDIIATATKLFNPKPCYILSNDRDLWQLKSSRVRIIYKDYPDILVVTKQNVREKFFGISDPRVIPLVKMLTGDSSDKLKGVYRFPRKVISSITYDMYKGKPEKALKGIKKNLTESVKKNIEQDKKRLLKLYKIVKLNKNLNLTICKNKGSVLEFKKFLKKRGMKDTRILKLWIPGNN